MSYIRTVHRFKRIKVSNPKSHTRGERARRYIERRLAILVVARMSIWRTAFQPHFEAVKLRRNSKQR